MIVIRLMQIYTKRRIAGFKPRFKNGLLAIEVAKAILNGITSKNIPQELRYLVGNNAFKLMEIRMNKSDRELKISGGKCYKMIVVSHFKSDVSRTYVLTKNTDWSFL